MKRLLATACVASMSFAGMAMAGQGGAPADHGTSGADWGDAVSGAAQAGGLGDHASGGREGGAPDAHGLSGADWGGAVSGAAMEGGLGDHASGN